MKAISLLVLCVTVASSARLIKYDESLRSYSNCGADRGYTEADSLEAATYLEQTLVRSDPFSMRVNSCIYAHVNTTVVSFCNSDARNRTVSRAEVKRGIEQLIKDCGLQGGFTGTHYVNNLTFSAYGVTGAPSAGGSSTSVLRNAQKLAKRDCLVFGYDGVPHFDCNRKYNLAPDGSCDGALTVANKCQVFCEVKRTGFLGIESRAQPQSVPVAPGQVAQITDSAEISITNGFSIGVDGVFEEVIGGGVTYDWSITQTTGHAIALTALETSTEYWSRWVYFPRLIESCGSVTRQKYTESSCEPGTGYCSGQPSGCSGDIETIGNVCSLVPDLVDGSPSVVWALRFEDVYGNTDTIPFDKQPSSYQSLCGVTGNPDGDEQQECFNHIPVR